MTFADYQVTDADRRPLPRSYRTEPRHLGYRDDDLTKPFAGYLNSMMQPVPSHVDKALRTGLEPTAGGYEVEDVAAHLSAPGYTPMETGWTRTSAETLVVSCLTDMPDVTAEMWDWWFGWHGSDSARYKLWHPRAHVFAAWGDDRSSQRHLTDIERYIGNVSYGDEYIGSTLSHFAIRFVEPSTLGFAPSAGTTHICARIGTSDLPVVAGWLVHQVRPTDRGSEMRSRFFLGRAEILDVPANSTSRPMSTRLLANPVGHRALAPVVATVGRRRTSAQLARDLLRHCAEEMNHLAAFLPRLFTEFCDVP